MTIRKNVIYVTGYWQIKNNKRPISEYYELSISTFQRLLSERVIFYSDDDVFTSYIKRLNPTGKWHFISRRIDHLTFYDEAKKFSGNQKFTYFESLDKYEKHNLHYTRDWNCDPHIYSQLLTVWLNKIILMYQTAKLSELSTVCWIDPTYSRFDKVRKNKIENYEIRKGALNLPQSYLHYQSKQIAGNASIILADEALLDRIVPHYYKIIKNSFKSDYLFDEEVIIEEMRRLELVETNVIDKRKFGQLRYHIRRFF